MERKIKSPSIGVLLSGGLDSAALVSYFLNQGYIVWPVYIRCHLRWEQQELFWAKKFIHNQEHKNLRPLKTLSLSLDNAYQLNWSQTGKIPGSHSQDSAVFLPARNLLLITKSLLYLSSKNVFQVALGILKGNPFKDAHPQYFKSLEKVLKDSFDTPVSIIFPFRNMKKEEVIKKQSLAPLHLSFSCINPKSNRHCGKCNKCAERKKAFRLAGVIDRTNYARG